MYRASIQNRPQHRGAILLLTVLLIVVLLGMIAFAVDLGYLMMAKTQLQAAADSAALAAAGTMGGQSQDATNAAILFAKQNLVGNQPVKLASSDITYGTWDKTTKPPFTPTLNGGLSNAAKVTARADSTTSGAIPLFFGRIFNLYSVNLSASATATCNPRDICFVVDLSGSMNDDTEPCWTTDQINSTFNSTVGNDIMQDVYDDFSFGTFPGTWQSVGQPAGVSTYTTLVTKLTNNSSYGTTYNIKSSDSAATKKTKAYKWLIDKQLQTLMPNALPYPNSSVTASLTYWTSYLDYVIYPQPTGASSSNAVTGLGNPQTSSYPNATTAAVQAFRNQIGYRTYVQFMMDYGRDSQPVAGQYTPLSLANTSCPKHSESTDGGNFSFPPREMPTHAARRSVIAALQVIKDRNANVSDSNQRDWVSIITFDKSQDASTITPLHDLNWNYDQAMQDCTTMQAVSDINASTSTSTGLLAAKNLLTSKGRTYTDKVIVLLTDGIPNLKDINSGSPPSPLPPNWPSDANEKAAMTQIYNMQSNKWHIFPVGIGMGCNYTFMDCAAVTGGTANSSGQSPRGSGDPSQYEETLKNIFKNIISNPKLRLVQ
jgi:Flp pilus assembly protein TadG